jgi:hypothetical protein
MAGRTKRQRRRQADRFFAEQQFPNAFPGAKGNRSWRVVAPDRYREGRDDDAAAARALDLLP